MQLTIFHTNDMHGRLEAMSRLSHFRRRLQAEAEAQGRATLFWDAGDAADRRVSICSVTKGAAFYPILNAMGYTLQAMGNAISLPYGPQAMGVVAGRAAFPNPGRQLPGRRWPPGGRAAGVGVATPGWWCGDGGDGLHRTVGPGLRAIRATLPQLR